MSVEVGLLLVIVVLIGGVVSLLARQRRHQTLVRDDDRAAQAEVLRAVRDLERYLDRKLDRLADRLAERQESPRAGDDSVQALAQALAALNRREPRASSPEAAAEPAAASSPVAEGPPAAATQPLTVAEPAASEGEANDEAELPPEKDAVPPEPAPVPPRFRDVEPERTRRLTDVLNTPDFLGDVWPRMVAAYDESRGLLGDFLMRQGMGSVHVTVHPPLPPESRDHWQFLVVERASPNGKLERVLIPRTYSRYDPSVHDHLFQVVGRGTSLENYLRECHAVALLKPGRELRGFIDEDVVEEKGVVLV